MMQTRDILHRLFRKEQPLRIFATVQYRTADGRYVVLDDQGRLLTVDGDQGYLPLTPVIIQSGRITGTGQRAPVVKTYRV